MHIPSTFKQSIIPLTVGPFLNSTQLNVTAVQCAPEQLNADAFIAIAEGDSIKWPARREECLPYYSAPYSLYSSDCWRLNPVTERAVNRHSGAIVFTKILCDAQANGAKSVVVDFEGSFNLKHSQRVLSDQFGTIVLGIKEYMGKVNAGEITSVSDLVIAMGIKTFAHWEKNEMKYRRQLNTDPRHQAFLFERKQELESKLAQIEDVLRDIRKDKASVEAQLLEVRYQLAHLGE